LPQPGRCSRRQFADPAGTAAQGHRHGLPARRTLAGRAGARHGRAPRRHRRGDARPAVRGLESDARCAPARSARRILNQARLHPAIDPRLQVAAKFDEPAGGLIARVAGLPGEPPVKLDLNGDGPLDAFRSNLVFTAGETIGAQGSANLDRAGAGRDLALALDARIEGLMPAPVAPVFAGSTRLDGAVGIRDDGGVDIRNLALVSALARLDVLGRYGADKTLDIRVTAAARPNANGKTVAAETEIGKLAFDATLKGPAAGPAIVATLDAADARLPLGTLGKLTARFTATPSGIIGEAGTRIALVSDGEATGVALKDAGLRSIVGDRIDFTLRGTGNDDATADFETLRLAMSGVELDYKGKLGQARILGQARACAARPLAPERIGERKLAGRAELKADLDATPRSNAYGAVLAGHIDDLSTGEAVLDRLLAGNLTLAGQVGSVAGSATVTNLRVAGRHATITADGAINRERSDLRVALALPDLRRADPRLSGKGDITLQLTGPQDRLDATAKIAVANATALGRPMPRLTIDAVIRDLQGALDTQATLAGEIDAKPATGTVKLARAPDDGWNLSNLDLSIGSVRLNGALTLDQASRAAGRLTLAARNLDDLSPLALTKLGGQLNADVTLAVTEGRQNLDLSARGQRLAAPSITIDRLDATVGARDIYGKPALDAGIAIDRAVVSGEAISAIRFDSKGAPEASAFTLSAAARGFALNGAGRLVPAEPLRLELASFEARRDGRRIALSQPASLSFPTGGVEIANLALAIDAGRLTLDGRAGESLDLRVTARNVPLSAARIAAPKLDLAGTLNAEAQVTGTPNALSGPWKLQIAGLATPETRQAALPPISIDGSGRLNGDRTSIEAALNAGRAANLTVRGTAPLNATGALDLSAQGRVDAAIANPMIAAQGQRVTGALALDLRAAGSASAPRLSGNATFSNGSFTDALQGVRLTDIAARIAANGDNLAIERISARAANGGTISANGQVRLDPAAGFPGTLRIQGERAQLVSSGSSRPSPISASTSPGRWRSGPRDQRAHRCRFARCRGARSPAGFAAAGRRHQAHQAKGHGSSPARRGAQGAPARSRQGAAGAGFRCRAGVRRFGAKSRLHPRARHRCRARRRDPRRRHAWRHHALDGGFDLRRGRLSVLEPAPRFQPGRLSFRWRYDSGARFRRRDPRLRRHRENHGHADRPTSRPSPSPRSRSCRRTKCSRACCSRAPPDRSRRSRRCSLPRPPRNLPAAAATIRSSACANRSASTISTSRSAPAGPRSAPHVISAIMSRSG
jgi:translocation and assembly module TamB